MGYVCPLPICGQPRRVKVCAADYRLQSNIKVSLMVALLSNAFC